MSAEVLSVATRAAIHGALGDQTRVRIVDELAGSDRTPGELRRNLGIDWNLLAFHLGVLESAGIILRRSSEGDRRRRYVRLAPNRLDAVMPRPQVRARRPLFVCTHNSARSQFAAALWRQSTGIRADSAGADPAPAVHPLAVKAAAQHGVDLKGLRPRGYDSVRRRPDVVVSVCDRAREAKSPFDVRIVHWSVPDPAFGSLSDFVAAFDDIAARMTCFVTAAS